MNRLRTKTVLSGLTLAFVSCAVSGQIVTNGLHATIGHDPYVDAYRAITSASGKRARPAEFDSARRSLLSKPAFSFLFLPARRWVSRRRPEGASEPFPGPPAQVVDRIARALRQGAAAPIRACTVR